MNKSKATGLATGAPTEAINVSLYALNLAEDGRILSATEDQYGTDGQPRVTELPTGETEAEKDISNYKYIDGEYIYDPLPQPEQPETEPTADEDMMGLLVEHEYRLTLLELGIAE